MRYKSHYEKMDALSENSETFENWHGSLSNDKDKIREIRLKQLMDKDK